MWGLAGNVHLKVTNQPMESISSHEVGRDSGASVNSKERRRSGPHLSTPGLEVGKMRRKQQKSRSRTGELDPEPARRSIWGGRSGRCAVSHKTTQDGCGVR